MGISDGISDVCSADLISECAAGVSAASPRATPMRLNPNVTKFLARPPKAVNALQTTIAALMITTRFFASDIFEIEIGRASCRERVCQYVEISVVARS